MIYLISGDALVEDIWGKDVEYGELSYSRRWLRGLRLMSAPLSRTYPLSKASWLFASGARFPFGYENGTNNRGSRYPGLVSSILATKR